MSILTSKQYIHLHYIILRQGNTFEIITILLLFYVNGPKSRYLYRNYWRNIKLNDVESEVIHNVSTSKYDFKWVQIVNYYRFSFFLLTHCGATPMSVLHCVKV